MDRPKRATKAPIRLINDPYFGLRNQKKEVDEPVNKRQPKKQPQQLAEQLRVSERIASKTPNAPTKTKKTERRTLNLDLPENKPSKYEKFIEDWHTHIGKTIFIHRGEIIPHKNIKKQQINYYTFFLQVLL
jgi:hypothetical protein